MPESPQFPFPDATVSSALIITADRSLRQALLHLVTAAGATAHVTGELSDLDPSWHEARLVVVGADLAAPLAAQKLPRRPGVVLVGLDLDDGRVWNLAVELGAESVVFLPDANQWLVARFNDDAPGSSRGQVVAVLGGRGGAGATTFAAALALTAARDRLTCMLVDADPLGGGIDLALGCEDTAGIRWPDLSASGDGLDADVLMGALPAPYGLTVLSCDRRGTDAVPVAAMRAVLAAGRTTNDVVVVDLPRRLDGATALAVAEAELTVLLVPAEVRATAAASRVAALVAPVARNLRVVVRGPAPGGLSATSVADALGLPLLAWLDPEPGLAKAMERGQPPARSGNGPLAKTCRGVLAELSETSSSGLW